MASNKDSRTVARRDRFKAFREETGWTQAQLGERMKQAAAELRFDGATSYDGTTVSKTEIGTRDVSFDDVAILAHIDPEGRDQLYFGWGLAPRRLTDEEVQRAIAKSAAGKAAAAKRSKPGGRA